MSIRDRIQRLEGRAACPECHLRPEAVHVFYPDEGEPVPEPERCPGCGRPLGVVIRVVYEEERAP